jgi:hypothetical protein
MVMLCNDCGEIIELLIETEVGDIISCPCCGLEYEAKIVNGAMEWVELTLEGLDYGE